MSSKPRSQPVAETALRARQRKKLIDACISALHAYGPSRTTVDKVVTIADMSPGIVNFYFETKAAMMVAALEYLAAEFEEQVLAPVAELKETPGRALELLIDLYLDPELASPRKVSVWYAFWGEANSRQEYHDICGNKDESFAALVRDLVERLIRQTGERHLDADGVALGLIGALEILWQQIAFQDEADLDRPAYKRRCMAYLRSVFPGRFDGAEVRALKPSRRTRASTSDPLPGWTYADTDLFTAERDQVFLPSWQFVGPESQLRRSGDYLTFDLLGERTIVLRDGGELRALRNACLARPHALTEARAGHFDGAIECAADGFRYAFDGKLQRAGTEIALVRHEVTCVRGQIFVRLAGAVSPPPEVPTIGAVELQASLEAVELDADWKVVAEQWLDLWFAEPVAGRSFAYPNLLIDSGADGTDMLQILPVAPGRCRVRRFRFGESGAGRLTDAWFSDGVAVAQSTQAGLTAPSWRPVPIAGEDKGAGGRFRTWLRTQLPALDEATR